MSHYLSQFGEETKQLQQSSPEDKDNSQTEAKISAINSGSKDYISLHDSDPIRQLDPSILASLNTPQIQAIQKLITRINTNGLNQESVRSRIDQKQLSNDQVFSAKKQQSKLIDIRFVIDLIFSRFYVVLLVGKDIRKGRRRYPVKGVTKVGNMIAAFVLIVAINLLISAFFLLGLYLLKSALDINLLPGHFSDQLERLN